MNHSAMLPPENDLKEGRVPPASGTPSCVASRIFWVARLVEAWKPALHPTALVLQERVLEALVAFPPNLPTRCFTHHLRHQRTGAAVEGPVTRSRNPVIEDGSSLRREAAAVGTKVERAERTLGGMRHYSPQDVDPGYGESASHENADLQRKGPEENAHWSSSFSDSSSSGVCVVVSRPLSASYFSSSQSSFWFIICS